MGTVPSYTRHCVHQIRQWTEEEIFFITDDISASKFLDSFNNMTIVNSVDLIDENIKELEKRRDSFCVVEKIFGRRHLFYYSCLRTFLMENFMKKHGKKNVFQIEIDNLIYFDPSAYSNIFSEREMTFLSGQSRRGCAGLLHVRNWECLNKYNERLLSYIGTSYFDSEMVYLWLYLIENPDRCYILPCIPKSEDTIGWKYLYENEPAFNKELFGPAHIGQYLTGVDRCHSNGILKTRYVENADSLDCGHNTFEWKMDCKHRRYPVMRIKDIQYKVMNLHVHSKDLEAHMSKPLCIPENKTPFSGEQIQSMCEMFIGTQEDSMCNPLFSGDKRWVFISNIQAEIDNPVLVYVPGHRLINMYDIVDKFKNKFVLIVHNSDENIDDRFLELLNNHKIIKMCAQNLILTHEKASVLPIGIANSQWLHGDVKLFRKIISIPYTTTPISFDYKYDDIYFFFNIHTNFKARERCKNILISKGLKWGEPQNFENYLSSLRLYKFAVCPVGNGIDTHRFWECILFGVIPIVENNPLINKLKPFYKMVILDSWDDFDINDIKISLPWLSNKLYFQDEFPL